MTPNPNPSPELKPCPFCGGKARLFPVIIPFDADCDEVTIQCTNCDAIGANVLVDQDIHGQCDLRDLEAEAIAAWNTRVSQTLPAPGEVERLRAVLVRICEEDRHCRNVKPNREGGIRGRGGMIAAFALTGKNGSRLTDEDVRQHVASLAISRSQHEGASS